MEEPTTRDEIGGNARLDRGDSENRHNATATTTAPGQAPSDDDDQGTAQGCTDAQYKNLLCDSDAGPGLRRCDGYADCANHRLDDYDNARRDDNALRDDNAASDELDGKTVTMTASGDNDSTNAGTSGAGTN